MRIPAIEAVGQTFGRLTVLSIVGQKPNHGAVADCQCSCGSRRVYPVNKLELGVGLTVEVRFMKTVFGFAMGAFTMALAVCMHGGRGVIGALVLEVARHCNLGEGTMRGIGVVFGGGQ